MPIRLMALDVDGTLTDEAGKISPENAAAVRRAMDAGVLVSLATGRPHQGVEAICSGLGINGPLILTNGSLVLSARGEIWHEQSLGRQDLRGVYRHAQKAGGLCVIAFRPEDVVFWAPGGMDAARIAATLDSFLLFRRSAVASPDSLPLERVNKVMLMGDERTVAEFLQNWPAELSHLARSRSYPYLGEVNPPGVGKGEALRLVCRRLGIAPGDVLAAGDGGTDLPMLRAAGHAVFVPRGPLPAGLPAGCAVVPRSELDRAVAWAAACRRRQSRFRPGVGNGENHRPALPGQDKTAPEA